ncbi:MAG: PRC-barrel domain-containing protein [Nanobdellota archaeon]
MARNMVVFSKDGLIDHHKLKDVLGKKVLTHNGLVIGRVKDAGFTRKRVLGFYISSIFKKYFVSMDYVDAFSGESLMLKIDPVTNLKGKIVFDTDGKRLGKVTEIKRPSFENEITEILVKKNIFTKPFSLKASDLEVVDKNIIMNKRIDDGKQN